MRVEPLVPDAPATLVPPDGDAGSASSFAKALDALGSVLETAQHAEDAFASGAGSLHDAIYERARAGVALSIATAAAQRTASAVSAVLNMQV